MTMYVVIRNGWIPERYFDTTAEAYDYLRYCQRNYKGSYTVRPCSDNHPERFSKAVLEVKQS